MYASLIIKGMIYMLVLVFGSWSIVEAFPSWIEAHKFLHRQVNFAREQYFVVSYVILRFV